MQKTPLSRILREELTRALVFGFGFFTVITLGFVGVAHAAADGGTFGFLLNQILASNDWKNPGAKATVKDSAQLGGKDPSKFVRVKAGQSCTGGSCIKGFDADGTAQCTP